MSAYEFLLALTFWQWVGVIILAAIVMQVAGVVVLGIVELFRKK